MINNGNDASDKGIDGDERYTPYYAVDPILKYLKPHSYIWCPFDKQWSAFVVKLRKAGHTVVATHIDNGDDFFLQPYMKELDYIISNPPFSIKDEVLDRLYHWGTPFMMLLPVPTIQGIKRGRLFIKYGVQMLSFDDRIGYHDRDKMNIPNPSHMTGSAYFCYKVLPRDLIVEKLVKYNRQLEEDLKC